jgi:hypothetical protein
MADSLLDLDNEALFSFPIDWNSLPAIADSFGRELLQYNLGAINYRFLTRDLNYSVQYGMTFMSKKDEYDVLNFFCERKGRYERFWIPIYAQMFTLAANITSGDYYFQIIDQNQYKTLHLYERLFIKLKTGDLITRKINSLNAPPNIFGVISAFDRNILTTDIEYFGRLILGRFDQDEIEINHETDSLGNCSLQFRELSKEYDLVFGGS